MYIKKTKERKMSKKQNIPDSQDILFLGIVGLILYIITYPWR